MNIEDKLKQLREDWKNVVNVTDDVKDIKIRRRVLEIRAKLLKKSKVDITTGATQDYIDTAEEIFNGK